MARARNIKPGFFTNDELAECEPLARILFAGLWCIADRAGRLEDRPKKIKAELLPYDSANIDRLLNQLAERKFIMRYVAEGCAYIQVREFEKHQNPHIKEAESTIPAPCENSANPVQALPECESPPERAGLIPDSLNLIPDSMDTSGKPDITPPPDATSRRAGLNAQALEVLAFLNEKTGRDYQPVPANLDLVAARLKEGATVEDCRMVIARKYRDWHADDKMRPYLRPATLFNATKFAQYRGELVADPEPAERFV